MNVANAAPPGLNQPGDWEEPPAPEQAPPPAPHPTDEIPPPSAEEVPALPETSGNPSGELPPIEARTSQVKPVLLSTSKRVYLMDVTTAEKPSEGKLLLLREGDQNAMALRVLKNIPDSNQIIAKRVRLYGNETELPIGREYLAIEKVSDKAPPPPTYQDQQDIAEVEPPLPFDPDLDAGSSPNPDHPENRSVDSLKSPEEDEDARIGVSIEDVQTAFEPYNNWITAGFGRLRNTPGVESAYYTGGGMRYGYNFSYRAFIKNERMLDFFTVEGGFYYYKVLNLDEEGDSYSVLPLVATTRYNVFFNENFGTFGYLGFVKNLVSASSVPGTTQAAEDQRIERVSSLSQLTPAIGVGAILRVGPQWYTRLDAGLDIIGFSLMLRF